MLAVLLLWWMTSGTALAWQTGEKIEWIPVRMLDGSTVNPSQLQGRFVFIQVWATWCPYCRLQNAALPELVRRWQQKGGVVLTLASDKTEKTVHAYLRAKQLQFPVAHITPDVRGWLGRTRIVPTVFIVGPDGSVLKTIEGQMLEDDLYELADLLQAPNGGTLSQ